MQRFIAAVLLLAPLLCLSQTRIKDIPASTNFTPDTKLIVDDATFGVRTMTIGNVRGNATNTLFLSDGILTGNRLVDLDGRTLAFEDGGAFEVDATNVFLDGLDALTIRSTNELNVIADGSFHLYTPRYFDTSSSSNAVLTLVDPLTGKAEFVTLEELRASTQTADRVLVLDGNKKLRSAAPSASEIDYVAGATNAIQTQIDARVTHVPTVADLVALSPFNVSLARTMGYHTAGDGGSGVYRWTDSLPAGVFTNRNTWFAGSSGFWERINLDLSSAPATEGNDHKLDLYSPSVTIATIADGLTLDETWHANPSLAWFDGLYHAVWDCNETGLEASLGQKIMWATSPDFVAWTLRGDAFYSSANANNPLPFDPATDYAFQPNLIVVGGELWCVWITTGDTYISRPFRSMMHHAKLASSASKWTTANIDLILTYGGESYSGFLSQNPIQLRSGRVLAPLTWRGTTPETIPNYPGNTFRTWKKQNGVIYTDDGTTWHIGGYSAVPGDTSQMWEPFVVEGENGALRMFSRNLHPLNYDSSALLTTAIGYASGEHFSPHTFTGIEAIDSRTGHTKQYGTRHLLFGSDNKQDPRQSVVRQNVAVYHSHTGADDFANGFGVTGFLSSLQSYPQGIVHGGKVRMLFSLGSSPRSMVSASMDAPVANRYYIHPRRNRELRTAIGFTSGSPAYFTSDTDSRNRSVTNTTAWGAVTNLSIGAWVWSANSGLQTDAFWDNRSGGKGLFLGIAARNTVIMGHNTESGGVNIPFENLVIPSSQWVFIGLTVDDENATAWLVNSEGAATTQTKALGVGARTWDGGNAYVGGASPSSLLGSWKGRIRSVRAYPDVVGNADIMRHVHALDAAALSAAAWAGGTSDPGDPGYKITAANPDAGTNNSAWLLEYEPTSDNLFGIVTQETFAGRDSLRLQGTGSASIEIPRNYPTAGDVVQFSADVYTPTAVDGKTVFLTLGSRSNRLEVVTRTNGVVEVFDAYANRHTHIGAVNAGEWSRLSVSVGNNRAQFGLGDAGGQVFVYRDAQARIFVGSGYGFDNVSATRFFHLDLESAFIGVRRASDISFAEPLNTRFPDLTVSGGVTVRSSEPTITLDDSDTETRLYLQSNDANFFVKNNFNDPPALQFNAGTKLMTIQGDELNPVFRSISYGGIPQVEMRRANGTFASPQAITSGTILGQVLWGGHDDVAFTAARAEMRAQGEGTWTTTSHPSRIVMSVTGSGSVTRREKLRLEGGNNIHWTDDAPVLSVGVGGGSAGLRVLVNGSSSYFFRVVNPGFETVFGVRTNSISATQSSVEILADGLYRVKVGANGTGPGGTGRALYIDDSP